MCTVLIFENLIEHGNAHPREVRTFSGKEKYPYKKGKMDARQSGRLADELRPYSAVEGKALGLTWRR